MTFNEQVTSQLEPEAVSSPDTTRDIVPEVTTETPTAATEPEPEVEPEAKSEAEATKEQDIDTDLGDIIDNLDNPLEGGENIDLEELDLDNI